MEPTQATQTIAQVIQSVMSTAAIIATTSGAITIMLVQGLKGLKLKTKFIGLIAIAIGFATAILFSKILNGQWFGVFNTTVAIFTGLAAPGAYSAARALKPADN